MGKRSQAASDAKAILNRIRQLVRALRAFEKETQRRFGLGAAQMFIVHVLGSEDDLSITSLAHRTATAQRPPPTAGDQLAEDGYVRRPNTPVNRRPRAGRLPPHVARAGA